MTQFADAFARARRLTRNERKAVKHEPKPNTNETVFEALDFENRLIAAIDHDLHPITTDLGLDEPIPHQKRPNAALARPSFPPVRTAAFAKTAPYHPLTGSRIESTRRTLIDKFGRIPDAKFQAPSTPNIEAVKSAEASLKAVVQAEDTRRANASATLGLDILLTRTIEYINTLELREYFQSIRPVAQARAWRLEAE